jgi:hypothetical protein
MFNPLNSGDIPTADSPEMASKAKTYHEGLQRKDRDPRQPPDMRKVDAVLGNIKTRTTPLQKDELAKVVPCANIGAIISGLKTSYNSGPWTDHGAGAKMEVERRVGRGREMTRVL